MDFFDTNFQKQYYQAINTDVKECQHCHRSFEGMEYIGDKCPYCGNLIEKDDDKNVHIR